MTNTQTHHETIVFERHFEAPVDRVFAAFADPGARIIWGVTSDTAVLIYNAANFTVGGVDSFRCGSRTDPKYHGETRYIKITPGVCIVSTETVDADGDRLSASLNTLQLIINGATTKVSLTIQLVAFGGRDMIEGTKFGHNAALNNLGQWLGASA